MENTAHLTFLRAATNGHQPSPGRLVDRVEAAVRPRTPLQLSSRWRRQQHAQADGGSGATRGILQLCTEPGESGGKSND